MEVTNPFGYINAINNKYEVIDKKGYVPFLTVKFFSYFRETVLLANIANEFQGTTKEQHYDFWFSAVPKRKRYVAKWHKKISQDDHIQIVAEYYQLNRVRAREALDFISEEEMKNLEEWWNNKK